MKTIITIQAIAIAVCLYYIGRLWFSRRDERVEAESLAVGYLEDQKGFCSRIYAQEQRESRLRALLHEAAGLLMDERHRSRARSGDARKTDNYGEWAKLRDDVVKRIGGEA